MKPLPLTAHFGMEVLRGPIPYDNTLVRMLGGPEVFTRASGNVSAGDFERAREALDHFDIVIILEEYDIHAAPQLAPRLSVRPR